MTARFLLALLLALVCPASAFAQTYTFTPQSSRELTLTYQTEREGASRVLVLGEVRNGSSQPCERVVIKVEGLDDTGRVVSRGRGYVPGTIRARASAPFEVRLSSAGSERRFRVEIETFEFVTRFEGQ